MKNKTTRLNKIYTGDSSDVLKNFEDNSIDAIVTDPPYGISFLGMKWDSEVPNDSVWKEAFRVLKPGSHLVSFSGSRTYHLAATSIEQAGFEIRDQIMWLYGSGFPRSYNINLAMERIYGATKAQNWHGWGTTLKPAHEPIVLARKPFSGTVVDNVLQFGTGGLNIDRSRVKSDRDYSSHKYSGGNPKIVPINSRSPKGRFPANVVHSGLSESWASYFYCAKPSLLERDKGLGDFALKQAHERTHSKKNGHTPHRGAGGSCRNFHPTVKPVSLMEHLITLVTPPDGVVLDPFVGSGSTLIAAKNLGYRYIGIERDADYVKLANARLTA